MSLNMAKRTRWKRSTSGSAAVVMNCLRLDGASTAPASTSWSTQRWQSLGSGQPQGKESHG